MQVTTRDHYELMEQFERDLAGSGRMDREPRELWSKGRVYQSGEINSLFLAYRMGAAYGRAVERVAT